MDPLVNIVPELYDWVFQQLDVNCFHELTQVTPKWNYELGKSLVMMEKVRLAISSMTLDGDQLSEINGAIQRTTRRYRNASVCYFEIVGAAFSNELLNALEIMSPTLVKLEINCNVVLEEKPFDKINLSGLKVLKVGCVPENMLNHLLARCNSLVKLQLISIAFPNFDDHPSIPSLRSFLKRNQSLKEIEVTGEYCNPFFEDDNSDVVRFKLKKLKIRNAIQKFWIGNGVERNLKNFLATQSQNLEKLHINICGPDAVEYIFNEMLALKNLSFLYDVGVRFLQLNVNKNIVKLSIFGFKFEDDFEKMIRVVPRLTALMTSELTPKRMEIISRFLPSLQTIKYCIGEPSLLASLWRNAFSVNYGRDKPLWPFGTPRMMKADKISPTILPLSSKIQVDST